MSADVVDLPLLPASPDPREEPGLVEDLGDGLVRFTVPHRSPAPARWTAVEPGAPLPYFTGDVLLRTPRFEQGLRHRLWGLRLRSLDGEAGLGARIFGCGGSQNRLITVCRANALLALTPGGVPEEAPGPFDVFSPNRFSAWVRATGRPGSTCVARLVVEALAD
jgi:hypothetical protein